MWDNVNEILKQSTGRIAGRIANFLPGLLALIVVVLLSVVLALAVRMMLRRFLQGIEFDKRVERWGFESLSDWSPSRSPTLLVSRLVYMDGGSCWTAGGLKRAGC
jgi:hypothetical protein